MKIYDIRDADKVATTLERLTGVDSIFGTIERMKNVRRINYSGVDKNIERIIKQYNGHYPRIDDFEFVITHLTTSGIDVAPY